MITATNARENVFARIDGGLDFPAPPLVVARLSELMANDDSTAEDFGKVVALDPAVSTRLLKVANSVIFGRGTPVDTIDEAVMRVGISGLRDLVYALAFARSYKPIRIDYTAFWRHSLAVAHAIQAFQSRSTRVHRPSPEAYTAGLLHDFGIIVLERILGPAYISVFEKARDTGCPLYQIEDQELGINHADAGARLLQKWKLPTLLVDAVRNHHRTHESASIVTQLVYISDFACNNQSIHNGAGNFPTSCNDRVWEDLGLEADSIPEIIAAVRQELVNAEAVLQAAK